MRWLLPGVLVLVGACTEEPPDTLGATGATVGTETNIPITEVAPNPTANSVVGRYAGETWFAGTVPSEPERATGTPIKIGHINQEDVPMGSFPEVRLAAETAVAFINSELNGVNGHPIELVTCIANFSIEVSQACAQEFVLEEVIAVSGGLDIMASGSMPVLEANGIPYVGGIPVGYEEMRSPLSFQFSGGTAGAMAAYATDAANRGATSAAVVYADFGPVKDSAIDYGVGILEARGVSEIVEVAYPIMATDMLPIITQAAANDPDAILMFAADAACVRTMEAVADLAVRADVYMVGSCAAPAILAEAGDDAEGFIFSVESPIDIDMGVVDGPIYTAAAEFYGPEGFDPIGAGTVSFRGVMNLWAALTKIDPLLLTDPPAASAALAEELGSAVLAPSYDGWPYTCDGNQVPGLPALCAPQQVLIEVVDGGLARRTDWIDVAIILQELAG